MNLRIEPGRDLVARLKAITPEQIERFERVVHRRLAAIVDERSGGELMLLPSLRCVPAGISDADTVLEFGDLTAQDDTVME